MKNINTISACDIFKKPCNFYAGAAAINQLPPESIPEFGFIGRSNVGKSSLVNSLTNNSKLARVSQNPGCTRQVNFFNLYDTLSLVDLPGYGYAKVSKAEKSDWDRLICAYLRGRSTLMRCFLLMDARHPFKKNDIEMMEFLDEFGISYQVVFTKSDYLKQDDKDEINAKFLSLNNAHAGSFPECLFTSSKSMEGILQLQEIIFAMCIGSNS